MRISGINGNGAQAWKPSTQETDSLTKSLQKQIENAQKQLQELSANETMSVEEKNERRQQLEQQIADLNTQLRQHQMEQRKEKLQVKGAKEEQPAQANKVEGGKAAQPGAPISQANMNAILAVDSAVSQAQVKGSAAEVAEGRVRVLKSEINQDGGASDSKQKELARMSSIASQASASQMKSLGEAGEAIKEAAAAEEDGKQIQSGEKEAATNGRTEGTEDGKPKEPEVGIYTKDGKPVPEEEEPTISVMA